MSAVKLKRYAPTKTRQTSCGFLYEETFGEIISTTIKSPTVAEGKISVSVSNLNPEPGEIVKFIGSADPVEDILVFAYDATTGEELGRFTIYLKTLGIDFIRLVPSALSNEQQRWTFEGKESGATAPSVLITIKTVIPPELSIILSMSNPNPDPGKPVLFGIDITPPAAYTVWLRAYVNGKLEGEWPVYIVDGHGEKKLVPSVIGDVVDWQVIDDEGNKSNTVTTRLTGLPPEEEEEEEEKKELMNKLIIGGSIAAVTILGLALVLRRK